MDEVVQCLIDFYDAEEIDAFRRQAFSAYMSRSTTTIHITSTSMDGRGASGMVLSTPDEQLTFIRQCRQALAALENDGAAPREQLGTGVDFRHRFTAS